MQHELEISPFNVPAKVRLAEEYVKEGKLDLALSLAEEVVKLEPKDASTHMAHGEALIGRGDSTGGIGELEKARDLAPENVMIRWALVRAYSAVGRTEDARQEKAAIEKLAQPQSQP
jgi:Flp pilus assembly protein TadD